MTTPIAVDGLRFEFDDTWLALKWDDHAAYRHGLNGHAGTKAIDIFALRHLDELWLIECGVVRSHAHRIRHRNTRRDKNEPLHEELASKVRDSFAAAVWVQSRHTRATELERYLRAGVRGDRGRVHVVLWFEGLEEAELLAIDDRVHPYLRWLRPRVHLLNTEICRRHPRQQLEGVTVSHAPSFI